MNGAIRQMPHNGVTDARAKRGTFDKTWQFGFVLRESWRNCRFPV